MATVTLTKVGKVYADSAHGSVRAVEAVDLKIHGGEFCVLVGPSGCGKSSFLRCINRMNDTISNCKIDGEITLDGQNIYRENLDLTLLRAHVGMVFQRRKLESRDSR